MILLGISPLHYEDGTIIPTWADALLPDVFLMIFYPLGGRFSFEESHAPVLIFYQHFIITVDPLNWFCLHFFYCSVDNDHDVLSWFQIQVVGSFDKLTSK